MTVGIGGQLRTGGRHPFYVIKGAGSALSPDLATADSGTPTFTSSGSGFSCSTSNSSNPRGLFQTGVADVEIKVGCDRSDGGCIYFRQESNNKVWRLGFGDYVSSTYTTQGHYSPCSPASCSLSSYSSHSTKNFCECANIYTGHTIYGSCNNPSYDYVNFWGGAYSAFCGTTCSSSHCTLQCLRETRQTYYYCVGGHSEAHVPGTSTDNYTTRWSLEYRNGSTTWNNVARVNRSVGDLRIVARGTSIEVYFGSVSANTWTLYSTYTDNITSTTGVYHGIGSGNLSPRYSTLGGGLNNIWIETL